MEMKYCTVQEDNMEEPSGSPHRALFFVLPYLPVFELISMSQVCVSLKDAVKNDILPWLNIIVQKPLKLSRLSDELLLQITNMANGRLRTLALINCSKITDDGLQRVIERNPLIDKLYIPACSGLTSEGVIRAVKTLSKHDHNLKNLWINGIDNVTKEHLETLHNYLQINMPHNQHKRKQRLLFHEYGNITLTGHERDYQPMLDLQICPICKQVRVVFDCPRKTCEMMTIEKSFTDVRGCKFCIPWCKECGKWVGPLEVEEAVCLDVLCLDCWLHLPKCDLCNKPYCKEHANERQHQSLGSNCSFVCDACHVNFIQSFVYNNNED